MRIKSLFVLLFSFILLVSPVIVLDAQKKASLQAEVYQNDPMGVQLYTLPNGLKVYLSVYKDAPRIQTFITVLAGGKNDPSETTGLAHYFEHLMFKGTKQYGTSNYALEEPLLNEIEALFEVYRKETDNDKRTAIYRQIDSVSQLASQYMIPNEYDKLMSAIGASGTNASTSNDITYYREDIPSNQIENWAKVQADRFMNCVIRGFHTELETVYEENNMYLTNDSRKMFAGMLAGLFPHHPYGSQTVIGTQEHLKNPSIINIKNFYKTYYVANNMAIVMAGDFDPAEAIKIIEKYFSQLPVNRNIPPVKSSPEKPFRDSYIKEIWGNDRESVTLGWRTPGAKDRISTIAEMAGNIFYNGVAGMVDLNINQKQLLIGANGWWYGMVDGGMFSASATPKQGQTLDEVKDILLDEIDKLKRGDFEDWLIAASFANMKLEFENQLTSIRGRCALMNECFKNGYTWGEYLNRFAALEKVTKKDITDFANRYLNHYICLFKKTGKDPNELTIEKPQITPITANRDAESKFLRDIQNTKIKEINPVFVDFKKDLSITDFKDNKVPFIYKQNNENNTFELYYIFDMGHHSDKVLGTAFRYLDYLGTSKFSPEEIKREFYKLACSFDVRATDDRVYIWLEGLSENMEKGLELMETLIVDAQVNQTAFDNMIGDIKKSRNDAKLNQRQIFSRLQSWNTYGPDNPSRFILSNDELDALTPQQLITKITDLKNYQHKIWYYGPLAQSSVLSLLNKHHTINNLNPPIPPHKFTQLQPNAPKVFFAPYNSPQIQLSMYSSKGEKYNLERVPIIRMYNEYFGGGMNAIVFQEMREARALAYSAGAAMRQPSRLDDIYSFTTFIGTQTDKMDDAVQAFYQIINDMPQSDKAFNIAKQSIISNIRTQRTTKNSLLWSYLNCLEFNLTEPTTRLLFNSIQKFKLSDIVNYQQQNIKNRTYTFAILGNPETMNFDLMSKYGPVEHLTLEQLFGY